MHIRIRTYTQKACVSFESNWSSLYSHFMDDLLIMYGVKSKIPYNGAFFILDPPLSVYDIVIGGNIE